MKNGIILGILLVVAIFIYALGVNWRQYAPAPAATSTPVATVEYISEAAEISFSYPVTYRVDSRIEGNAERNWPVIILMDKVAASNIPQGGEGPPSIAIAAYPNPEGLGLEQWILSDARSNWKLAAQDGGLGSRTVGGEPALAYRHSGLYETDAVAVAKNGTVYLLSAGWLTAEDKIRADFEDLLKTVKFL